MDYASFYASFVDSIKLWDVTVGLLKGTFFALMIALTSCHYGLAVKGGAVGVGHADRHATDGRGPASHLLVPHVSGGPAR